MENKQGGKVSVIRSGEKLTIESGGELEVAAGATALLLAAVASGYKLARGRHTTVAAADTVVTGLATVVAVVATLDSDPSDDPFLVSATIGDQAGTPAAGSIIIKTWKHDGTDPTPTAAATFSKKVGWIAVGT